MTMNLIPAQILELWECGAGRHPLDRALLLLCWKRPDMTLTELADITLGQRDQMLLAMRRDLFGRELQGYVDCPACSTRLEFTFDVDAFRSEKRLDPIEVDGLWIRHPTSRDLASVLLEPDPERAAHRLAQLCCSQAEKQAFEALPMLSADQLAVIESTLAEMDASVDIELSFTCTQCEYDWQTSFDISDFLWREIDTHAARLMSDIHTLARTYGWNEKEILSLSETRRAAYLERIWA